MYLVIDATKESHPLPDKDRIRIGTVADCDIQLNDNNDGDSCCELVQKKYGHVLRAEQGPFRVNRVDYREMAFIAPGDIIEIDGHKLMIKDEEFIPKELNELALPEEVDAAPLSSVNGIRSFCNGSSGEFIKFKDPDSQRFFHFCEHENTLSIRAKDDADELLLNGYPVTQARVSNGDVISSEQFKYIVESPGNSGFSKFSPSHPKNILLSEKYEHSPSVDEDAAPVVKRHPLKDNLWWITMVLGLIGMAILVAIKI